MEIRKTYLSVKIPTSRPEYSETSPEKELTPKKSYGEVVKTTVSLASKLSAMIPKYYIPPFPSVPKKNIYKSNNKLKSQPKESLSPAKMRKYVKSVLDYKKISKDRLNNRNYSFVVPSDLNANFPNKYSSRNKLIPLRVNRSIS
jgi:hypothetical protein